jgi:hypothetical protein
VASIPTIANPIHTSRIVKPLYLFMTRFQTYALC